MRITFSTALKVAVGKRREGFTLMEILMAMGILAFGLFGVLTLFPVAIRSVGVAVNQTTGPAVGQDAILGLQRPEIDQGYGFDIDIASGETWPEYVPTAGTFGDGFAPSPATFKIPDHTNLGPGTVTPQWATSYGWTASFLPLTIPIDDETDYRVQVAVWRDYDLIYDGATTATFTLLLADGSNLSEAQLVTGIGGASDLTDRVSAGDYVRLDDHGVWYRIATVVDASTVELVSPFRHPAVLRIPPVLTLTGACSFASRFRLIGLHETEVGPRR